MRLPLVCRLTPGRRVPKQAAIDARTIARRQCRCEHLRQRDAAVGAFEAGGAGCAVSYAAGGTGLDGLQRRASRALLLDLPWTPARVEQAIGRLCRIGQAGTSILVTVLVADHWVDRVLAGVVARKLAALDALGVGLAWTSGLEELA